MNFILEIVFFTMYSMYYVICLVSNALYSRHFSMHYFLHCIHGIVFNKNNPCMLFYDMQWVLWVVFHSIHCIQWIILCALRSKQCILCIAFFLFYMHFTHCNLSICFSALYLSIVFYEWHFLHCVLCIKIYSMHCILWIVSSFETKTMNLLASVMRRRLRPRLLVSRLRMSREGYNVDDLWPNQKPSIEYNR